METTFKDRLVMEQADLSEKMTKLFGFMNSPKFAELDYNHRSLLEIQYSAMNTYYKILTVRLSLLQ